MTHRSEPGGGFGGFGEPIRGGREPPAPGGGGPSLGPSDPAERLAIALTILIGVSAMGFVVGLARPGAHSAPVRAAVSEAAEAHEARVHRAAEVPRTAPRYEDRREGPPRDRSAVWGRDRSALSVEPGSPRVAALHPPRHEGRAYDGAPPTVPHPIGGDGTDDCLACHERGLKVAGRAASAMAHDLLGACTQCHLPQTGPAALAGAAGATTVSNSFAGLVPAEAPPPRGDDRVAETTHRRSSKEPCETCHGPLKTPHPRFMRERCESCHGPLGRHALGTSHPQRESCTRCHEVEE